MRKLFPGIVACFYLFISHAFGQTTPSINSGNPVYPFPQFLPYVHPDGKVLGTLADHNSEGVPHAELEQRVRDAWQIMCNNINPVAGAKVGGVQYLRSEANMDCHCAEAYGYYLLAAAFMGDKNVYDGLYMYYHDNSFNGVKRFIDGVDNKYGLYSRGLSYAGSFGAGAEADPKGGGAKSGNSATDGDHDIALATLVAYKQWGEKSGIVANGKEINYKEEALNYIRAMVDTGVFSLGLPEIKYYTGIVGLDGYMKSGDTGNELTNFAQSTNYHGIKPERTGGALVYFDYSAPAYYKQFGDWLTSLNESPWSISQFKRGEASSDWLMGQLYSQGPQKLPFAGHVALSDANVASFTPADLGEDFRASWRTILNYVWHGNPTYTWDPVAHEVKAGTPNTYELDMGQRAAKFAASPQSAPWLNTCKDYGTVPLTFKGPYTNIVWYTPDGVERYTQPLNWGHGTLSPSAIAAQDFTLMGDIFRQCVIAWDSPDSGYLTSHPSYYHEWFRLLAMLVVTGQNQAPLNMVPTANLKVYHSIDKTVAFNNDLVTFTIDYRNFGTIDASGSNISFTIPADLTYVSSSKTPALSGNTISWNLGTVPGFKTGGLAATKGSFTVTFKLAAASSGRYAIVPKISCANGSGWTSNEYPNRITNVMERNSVDVIKRALKITKTANYPIFNPGDTLTYTIDFTNSSDAGWINGGRPGVNFSFANTVVNPKADRENLFKFRIFHDAAEPYIDYGNYRFSYFLNEPSIKCISGDSGCPAAGAWSINNSIYEGGDRKGVKFLRESIVPGSDSNGSWNQRIAIKFAPQLATITQHLLHESGKTISIKEGGNSPLRGVWQLTTNSSTTVWDDDWSWDAAAKDGDGGLYYPITPDVTNPLVAPIPVTKWHRSSCETATKTINKVLVEEWDGYVWRRIFGNGPLPGRDIDNVVVVDTLPKGLSFAGFTGSFPFGIAPICDTIKNIITWKIPKLLINQKGKFSYLARASMPSTKDCQTADEKIISKAWISGNAESPFADLDTLTISCKKVTICNSAPTFAITTDKPSYLPTDSEVSYKIQYTQSEGSIGTSTLTSPGDWTLQSGTAPTISGGTLRTIEGSNILITHNFSHGTNTIGDGIQGRLNATYYSRIGVALRYNPTTKTGVFLAFKVDALYTNIYVYNASGALLTTGTIPSTATQFDFQIQLTGPKLELWLGKVPFDGPAEFSFNGLPVQPGYAGIVEGAAIGGDNYGSHSLIFWKAHLDSGFDIVLYNPLPGGIASTSAVSTGGVSAANGITWTLSSAGVPVLYGTKFNVSWSGTIKDCKSGLNDKAYVSMLGQAKNFLQTCVSVSCSSSVVTTDPIEVKLYGQNTQANSVLLLWSTTSVANTAYFEVLQSIGGNTWVKLTNVAVAGTNLAYTYEDLHPSVGISYYQVNQVLNDSTVVSSPIINIGHTESLTFIVENKNGLPFLTWLANESNTDHFEAMRSQDGLVWEVVSTNASEGTGTVYTYLDPSPLPGTSYYEIRQVLKNGFSYTSAVIPFNNPTGVADGIEEKALQVFPNPIGSHIYINWQTANKLYDVQLYSALGNLVYSQTNLNANQVESLKLGNELASGAYILKVRNENSILHRQLIKK